MEKIVLYKILGELSKYQCNITEVSYIVKSSAIEPSSWVENKDFVMLLDCEHEKLMASITEPSTMFTLFSNKVLVLYKVGSNEVISVQIPELPE